MAVEAQDLINRAREIIERDGWCQDTAHDSDGSHCMLGGLELAAKELLGTASVQNDTTTLALVLVCDQIVKDYPEFKTSDFWTGAYKASIPSWNDDRERTAEDVLLTLKKSVHGG